MTQSASPDHWFVAFDVSGQYVGMGQPRLSGNEIFFRSDFNRPAPANVQSVASATHAQCAQFGQVASPAGGSASNLVFRNVGSGLVSIFWVDEKGQVGDGASAPVPLVSLQPSAAASYEASPAHWFVAVDANGQCVGMGQPSASNNELAFSTDLSGN